MSPESDRTPRRPGPEGSRTLYYRESLRTPWWWYPIAISVAAILAAEFHVGGYTLTDWIPFSTLLPFSIAIVWWLGHSKLVVTSDEVRIRGAHLPLLFVSEVVALDARTLRRVIGREGDPRAFVAIRPWIGPGLQLQLDDPDDPTPYWIVSTRRPDRVAKLLRERRDDALDS